MTKPKFADRFGVVTKDLEEYLVSCPVLLLPLVWIPGCAFTIPHLRGSGTSLAPSCGVRGSFIFIAGLVLRRPSREGISSPHCHSLSTTRGQHETAKQRTWLREELRIAGQERGLLAEEDNAVIERSTSAHHYIITDFRLGLHGDG